MTLKTISVMILMFLAVSVFLYAEKPLEFTLENNSGLTIFVLRLSPAGSGVWTNDVLDGEVVADQKTIIINFSPEKQSEYWDLAVVDLVGDNYEWKAVRIITGKTVTLLPPFVK
ncbi:MAG: hypothetical protein EHM28_01660 [Spirochaetaceae bacterium]|nr:MAG: hypothetical protein EHM28_01660 [Spirochaetaceae bacterium]